MARKDDLTDALGLTPTEGTMTTGTSFVDDQRPEFGEPVSPRETEDEALADNEAQIERLGQTLYAKFAECERQRQPVEDRWLEDVRQYHGRYDPSVDRSLTEAKSCSLFLNITKPKTHAFSARIMDMVLPTDEKNWGIEPTPVPEMAALSDRETVARNPDTGQPMQTPEGAPILYKDIADAVQAEARDRAEAMEDEIDDQLTEAQYNAIQRRAIEQMAKLGTGVIMGPVINDEWRVKWDVLKADDGRNEWVRRLVPNVDKRPGVQWVDVWNFYPDMSGNTPDEWGFAFVQYLVNSSQLKRMAKRFNFREDGVRRVLDAGTPFNVRTLRWMNELRDLSETQTFTDNRYRLLRYYGEIEADDLEAVGMDPEALGVTDIVWGIVWLCDGVVLKVDLNPLDSGDLPFSVAYCDKDEASPFGTGIPRLMRGEQESVNSAWRMKHDNAGLSVCPQTVMKLNSVTPADGDYHMKPKKMWYAADDVQRVSDVFAQFSIDSHQQELDNILQLAIRFADDVTQLPLLMQGDQAPHITQTAQGMSLLYNASTVVLRRSVKFYDDFVTVPLINRMYEWNMQFNAREEIKGDFRTVARGSSTLLDKEQQGQALDMAMQFATSPVWQPYTDMKKLYREALKAKRIPDIMATDDEIKKALEQQAQAAQAAGAQGGGGGKVEDPTIAAGKMRLEAEKINTIRQEIASKERIAVAEFALKRDISLKEAEKAIASIKVREDAQTERFNAELAAKYQTGQGI